MRRLATLLPLLLVGGCGGSGEAAKPAATATADPVRAAVRVCEQHRAEVAQLVAEAVDRRGSRRAAIRAALPALRRSYGRLRELGFTRLADRADDSLPILARAAERGRLTRAELRDLRAVARDTRPLARRLGLRACMA